MGGKEGTRRGRTPPPERLTCLQNECAAPRAEGLGLERVLQDPAPPARVLQDPLLLVIVGTAVLLAVGLGLLAALWGRGSIIRELPLFVPTIAGFTALAAACVAFLAFGRYQVLREPSAYWAGLAFGAMSILYVAYVLTWPDVGLDGRYALATLPNTSAWIYNLALATTGLLLVAASAASWPRSSGRAAPWVVAVAGFVLVAAGAALSVVYETSLPQIVAGEHYTPATRGLAAAFYVLYGGGALVSVVRYRSTADKLMGHIALFQVAVAFAVLAFGSSFQRYDPWWYFSRLVVAGALAAVLFGLLGQYVGLYRRERERTWALDQQRALLHAVIDQMPAGVVIAEAPSGRALVVNHRMAQLFRRADLPANALEQHPSRQGYRPDGRLYGPDEWPLGRTIRYGEVVHDEEITIVRGDGTRGVISVNGAPVRDASGRIVAGVIVDLDITERKAAEEALRQLNEALEERVAERTRQLRALAAQLTMAEEQERRRLARVLHDDLQQVLAAATYHLESLRLQAQPGSSCAGLEEPLAMLREAILTSRTLTAQLSPTILYEMGLEPALHWLGRQMGERHGLTVTVKAEERADAPRFPEDVEVFLYQAARELLYNVAKHAATSEATLCLTCPTPNVVEMTVTDNGRGFDAAGPAPQGQRGGFGLFGISERLQHIGGHMRVDSAPGRGVRVVISVPLPTAD